MTKTPKKATYPDYLQLEKILSAQKLMSAEAGHSESEEHFFIIVHQVYELWFKQLIFDLDNIFAIFKGAAGTQDMQRVLIYLRRMNKILHLLLQEFEVLETLTPLEFLNFRNYIGSMSGFQSYQFRLLEIKLGLKREERMLYAHCPFDVDLQNEEKEVIHQTEGEDSLFACITLWLERLPYLEHGSYVFRDAYKAAFEKMMAEESLYIKQSQLFLDEEKPLMLKRLEEQQLSFDSVFDPQLYASLLKQGQRHLSYRSFMAALFIRLYRRHAFLQLPDLVLTEVEEVNALFNEWRYRHSIMVKKMIGWKTGTGGSSGVSYLESTINKYDVFKDLYLVPMVLLPEVYIPPLPPGLIPPVNFFFNEHA